jgi:hypothetical protein
MMAPGTFSADAASKVFFWHNPAHVLVGIFAGRQPKPFGEFLDPKLTFGASNMMIARRGESETSSHGSGYDSAHSQATAHRASSLSSALACFKSSVSKPSVNQP